MKLVTMAMCAVMIMEQGQGKTSGPSVPQYTDAQIKTNVGDIIGKTGQMSASGKKYTVFLSIPYAEPPVGKLRFSKPVMKAKFSQPYDAKEEKLSCPQNFAVTDGLVIQQVSEDCLHLSLFVPGELPLDNELRPVFIWFYGGAFQYGSTTWYSSPAFVTTNNVILVTVNYRMSVTGFLANPNKGLPGNWGLWDQQMAIQWVNRHIISFGGNKSMVTLFGESAGSASVIYQALYPHNEGLFNRFVAQSGAPTAPFAFDHFPEKKFETLISRVNCNRGNMKRTLSCLRDLSLVQLQSAVPPYVLFFPVVDKDFIKLPPSVLFNDGAHSEPGASEMLYRFGELDGIISINSNDGAFELYTNNSFLDVLDVSQPSSKINITDQMALWLNINFGLNGKTLTLESVLQEYTDWSDPTDTRIFRQKYLDFIKDMAFAAPITSALVTHAQQKGSGNLYFYEFAPKPSFSRSPNWVPGANHGEEIPFVLAFPESWMLRPWGINYADPSIPDITDEELELSEMIMQYLKQFSKTGDPNWTGIPAWPKYTIEGQKYIVFNITSDHGQKKKSIVEVRDHMRLKSVNFWNHLFPLLRAADECEQT